MDPSLGIVHDHLRRLKHADSSVRLQAYQSLIELEVQEVIDDSELLNILESDDLSLINYAISAIGRTKLPSTFSHLAGLYRKNRNPVVLLTAIDTFIQLKESFFCDVVIDKLNSVRKDTAQKKEKKINPLKNIWSNTLDFSQKKRKNQQNKSKFTDAFIEFQILIPSLKYLQIIGDERAKQHALTYLSHKHAGVRWNALLVFRKTGLFEHNDLIRDLSVKDTSHLVREQASLMLGVSAQSKDQA